MPRSCVFGGNRPYLQIVDAEMTARGEPALTFRVRYRARLRNFRGRAGGRGGARSRYRRTWDSTNVADGVVSVVTRSVWTTPTCWAKPSPRLRPKSPALSSPAASWFLRHRTRSGGRAAASAREKEAPFAFEGVEFGIVSP